MFEESLQKWKDKTGIPEVVKDDSDIDRKEKKQVTLNHSTIELDSKELENLREQDPYNDSHFTDSEISERVEAIINRHEKEISQEIEAEEASSSHHINGRHETSNLRDHESDEDADSESDDWNRYIHIIFAIGIWGDIGCIIFKIQEFFMVDFFFSINS